MSDRFTYDAADHRPEEIVIHGATVHIERIDQAKWSVSIGRGEFLGHGFTRPEVLVQAEVRDLAVSHIEGVTAVPS